MKQSKCLNCGKTLEYTGSRPKKWCGTACRSDYRYKNDKDYREQKQYNGYEEQVKRAKSRKLRAIALKGGSCEKCGEKHPAALCFHHVDPETKSFRLDARVFGNSKWEAIEQELNKCALLCFNCHQILHFSDYWKDWYADAKE